MAATLLPPINVDPNGIQCSNPNTPFCNVGRINPGGRMDISILEGIRVRTQDSRTDPSLAGLREAEPVFHEETCLDPNYLGSSEHRSFTFYDFPWLRRKPPNKRLELTEGPDNKNGRRETSSRVETTVMLTSQRTLINSVPISAAAQPRPLGRTSRTPLKWFDDKYSCSFVRPSVLRIAILSQATSRGLRIPSILSG